VIKSSMWSCDLNSSGISDFLTSGYPSFLVSFDVIACFATSYDRFYCVRLLGCYDPNFFMKA
jgi:hypothetical protein